MSCTEEYPGFGRCRHHVTALDEDECEVEFHVAERLTFKPDGEPHTTYKNSKWVKQWPVSTNS